MHRKLALSGLVLAACATAAPPGPAKTAPAPQAAAPATAPPPAAPGIDAAAMDTRVSPCVDFHAYACGGWLARTEIPPDKSRWGRFNELQERNLERLHAILDADAAGQVDAADPYGKKVGDFYAACMDEAGIEKAGVADLRAEWKKVDAVRDARSLAAAVGSLQRQGVGVLFRFRSQQDFKDSTKEVAMVGQGGLGLPDRDYYLQDDARSAEIRKSYLAHVEKMLGMAGVPGARAAREAKAVFELERTLAASYWTRTEMRDPARIYNPVGLGGLEKAAPRFPWKVYLASLGAPPITDLFVTTPKAVSLISDLARKTPAATWRAYLRWHVLSEMAAARALPRAFVDEDFAFTSRNFTGAKELEPRWKHCVRATDAELGEALGRDFVHRWFGGGAREKALELVRNIQAAQGANLATLAWMDDATRRLAEEKLRKIDNKIGYPEKWRDYSSLEVDRRSYLRSLLAADAFEVRRNLAKIGKPVDRGEWFMSPPTVNAYYNPLLNEMVFPAGILQPVFYTRGANDAVNYGAIGFVVGHELTHGFDDQGRKFDAAGNLADWWSPPVSQEFEKRAACVERQYSGYAAVDDLKLNGKLTLGENIADLGGLKLALAAYRASRQGKLPEAPVDGLGPEQQFFVAAAQVWCDKARPEEARRRVVVDPHSPGRWRVDGPLSNLPEFAAAFGCKAGDPMVRADRCEVW